MTKELTSNQLENINAILAEIMVDKMIIAKKVLATYTDRELENLSTEDAEDIFEKIFNLSK